MHLRRALRCLPTVNFSTTTSVTRASQADKMLRIAIIGRPNVGKSTLFNRLTKSKLAIVTEIPGTTRDRKDGQGNLGGVYFSVTDTGGLDDRGAVCIEIQKQVKWAMKSADILFFLIDAKAGLTALDKHFADWIRVSLGKLRAEEKKSVNSVVKRCEIYCLANKTEGANLSNKVVDTLSEAYSLGFGEPIPISSAHGDGMADIATILINAAEKRGLPIEQYKRSDRRGTAPGPLESSDSATTTTSDLAPAIAPEDRVIQFAIMGRPNVGKSTLLNAILGEERVITGPTAGLTRDSVHVEWEYNDRKFKLVDTAGLTRIRTHKPNLEPDRKRAAAAEKVGYEKIILPGTRAHHRDDRVMDPDDDPSQFSYQISEMALQSALNALRFSQVVLLVVEGGQGSFSKVDLQIARKCLTEGRALVVAANKSDLVVKAGVSAQDYALGVQKHCDDYFKEFGTVPVLACSASENIGVRTILDAIASTHDAWTRRTSTWVLNTWLKDLLVANPPPRISGKALKLKYITQVKIRPPCFAIFSNVQKLPTFFTRFMRAKLQEDFKLEGVPIVIVVRKTTGAEVKKHLLRQSLKSRRGIGHNEARGVGVRKRSQKGGATTYRIMKRRATNSTRRKRVTRGKNQKTGRDARKK